VWNLTKHMKNNLINAYKEFSNDIANMDKHLHDLKIIGKSISQPWSFKRQRISIEQIHIPSGHITKERLEKIFNYYLTPQSRFVRLGLFKEALKDGWIDRSDYKQMKEITENWNDNIYNNVVKAACHEAGASLWLLYMEPGYKEKTKKISSTIKKINDAFEASRNEWREVHE
jgi:hypothetical protein